MRACVVMRMCVVGTCNGVRCVVTCVVLCDCYRENVRWCVVFVLVLRRAYVTDVHDLCEWWKAMRRCEVCLCVLLH